MVSRQRKENLGERLLKNLMVCTAIHFERFRRGTTFEASYLLQSIQADKVKEVS